MLVIPDRKALLLTLKQPARVTTVVPDAKQIGVNSDDFPIVAVPYVLDAMRVLRNIGINVPSPIQHYYGWPGRYTPFEAQKTTAEFLTFHPRAYVLNDLGTGKTLSVLWAYDYLRSIGVLHRALVVSPLSTLERTWADEVFLNFPHLTANVLHGSRDRRLKLLNIPADLYLINHDGIKTDGIEAALAQRPDIDLVIVDEIAQVGRSAGVQRWKVLNKLANKQHPRSVWGLTGTPTPNSPTDAWGQVRLVTPERVTPYAKRFRDQVMYQQGPFKWSPRGNAVEIVREVMQPAVRFSRDQCVDLPPVTYQTRHVPLTPEAEKAYKEMMRTLATEVDGDEILAINEAVKVSKLLQIVCGVVYGKDGDEMELDASPRMAEVLDVVENSESKVIVFAPFVSVVNAVAKYLEQHTTVNVIYGAVPKNKRDETFRAFQNTPNPKVIVAQPAAMSHGLTLTAASTIVWYSPVNSNDTYEQANGRITRPGQKHNQLIVNIEGSLAERKIYERLKARQSLQGALLSLAQNPDPNPQ